MAYGRSYDMRAKVVRIFNTYGPRMRSDDGRAVPNFIARSYDGPILCTAMGRKRGPYVT